MTEAVDSAIAFWFVDNIVTGFSFDDMRAIGLGSPFGEILSMVSDPGLFLLFDLWVGGSRVTSSWTSEQSVSFYRYLALVAKSLIAT